MEESKTSSNLKSFLLLFLFAFSLNLIWENIHSFLYVHYKGGSITEQILLFAAFADAVFITLLGVLARLLERARVIILGGLLLAISIEKWALLTGRWEYSYLMPIIPLIETGLTPTLQLAVSGYISYYLAFNFSCIKHGAKERKFS